MVVSMFHGSHMDWKNEKTVHSGNFEWTGKMKFYQKYWKNEEILANFYFFSDFLIEVYLLNRFFVCANSLNKTLKL